MAQAETWQSIAEKKRADLASRIPKEWLLPASYRPDGNTIDLTEIPRHCGLLSTRELELTEKHDATELLELLRSGRLKSREVVEAFCKVRCVASIRNSVLIDSAVHREQPLRINLLSASLSRFFLLPCLSLSNSTSTSPGLASPKDLYMASQSRSRTVSDCQATIPPSAL